MSNLVDYGWGMDYPSRKNRRPHSLQTQRKSCMAIFNDFLVMLARAEKSGSLFPLYDIVETPEGDGDEWMGLIP
jgi:hypothetical protein